jgi:hypothetical protein
MPVAPPAAGLKISCRPRTGPNFAPFKAFIMGSRAGRQPDCRCDAAAYRRWDSNPRPPDSESGALVDHSMLERPRTEQ